MAIRTRELYHSPNGDRWYLTSDADSGRVFVRHHANRPSGGQVSDIEIGAFLARGGQGPEHVELLRLVGTLVESAAADQSAAPARVEPRKPRAKLKHQR